MVVIVKNGTDTSDGKRGVKLARDMAADLFLIQNGVYFAQDEGLEGFSGTVAITYAIAIILPITATFFIAFAILEGSGYLPRLAIMSNRIFNFILTFNNSN